MTPQKAGRKGGLATLRKHGVEHFRQAGKLGFQATIVALAERQHIPADIGYNAFRNLLTNLQARKV